MHEMPIRTVHLDQVRGRPNQATQVRKTSAIHVSPSIQHRPSDLNGYFDHLTACELEHMDRPQIVLVRTNREQSPDQSSKLPKGVFPSGPSPQGGFFHLGRVRIPHLDQARAQSGSPHVATRPRCHRAQIGLRIQTLENAQPRSSSASTIGNYAIRTMLPSTVRTEHQAQSGSCFFSFSLPNFTTIAHMC